MNDNCETTLSPETSPQQPVDALTLWRRETASSGSPGISTIRLDASEKLLTLFTSGLVRVQLHYIDSSSLRDYVHCLGKGCLLCRLGRQIDVRDLLPAFDAVNRVVGALSISPNLRPRALRPQMLPLLERLQRHPRPLVGIRKVDNTSFIVSSYDLPDGADDGADVILAFLEEYEAGRIDFGSVFSRLGASELAAIPEIAAMMSLKGISLP